MQTRLHANLSQAYFDIVRVIILQISSSTPLHNKYNKLKHKLKIEYTMGGNKYWFLSEFIPDVEIGRMIIKMNMMTMSNLLIVEVIIFKSK